MTGTSDSFTDFGMPASCAAVATLSGPTLMASGTKMVLMDLASAWVRVQTPQLSPSELLMVVPLTSIDGGPLNVLSRLMPSFSAAMTVYGLNDDPAGRP